MKSDNCHQKKRKRQIGLNTVQFSLSPYNISIIQTKPFLYRHEIRGIEKLNIEEQEGTTHASPEVRTSLRALWGKNSFIRYKTSARD